MLRTLCEMAVEYMDGNLDMVDVETTICVKLPHNYVMFFLRMFAIGHTKLIHPIKVSQMIHILVFPSSSHVLHKLP